MAKTLQVTELVLVRRFSGRHGDALHVERWRFLPGARMIDATECRELAAECRQMADHAQTVRVRSILIDIARTWDRLALEVEHSTARITPKEVLRRPDEVFTRK